MKTILTPEKIEYIKQNYGTLTTEEIANHIGISKKYLILKAMRLGLSGAYRPKLDKIKIVDLYKDENMNYKQISRKYGVDRETIKRLIESSGISIRNPRHSNRKYLINDTYFKNIDTEEKAYWLGMLYADGNVKSMTDKNSQKLIKLTQHSKDRYILEEFKRCLGSTHPIVDSKRSECSDFYFCNVEIYEDLLKLGCIPKKSLILVPPNIDQVPTIFIRHFIRGFFDGDGSISLSKTGTSWKVSFATTIPMLTWIGYNVLNTIGIEMEKIQISKRTSSDNWGQAGFGGGYSNKKQRIEKLYNFLYEDATIFLRRKRQIFETAISYKPKFPNWPSLPIISGCKKLIKTTLD